MTWEQIITILLAVGNVIAIILNFKKLSESSNEGAAWRATVDNVLKNIINANKEIKDGQKENTGAIRTWVEAQIRQQGQIDSLRLEMEALKTATQNSVQRVDNCISILKNKNLI